MKNFSPIKRSISLAMILLLIVTVIGMLGSTVFADTDAAETAAVSDTAADSGSTDSGTGSAAPETASLEEVADNVAKQISNQQSGIWHTISIPFGYVVRGCSYISGGSYVIALLLYALAMKILLFPFGIKQQKNSVKQARLRPKEQAIRDKYAGRTDRATQQKMQEEIMTLYRSENFNPMGGCLPLLLQLPILFALYRVVYNPLRHVVGLSTEKIMQIARNLVSSGALTSAARGDIDVLGKLQKLPEADYSAAVKGITDVSQKSLPNISLFGLDLSVSPMEAKTFIMYLIPVLVFVSSFVSMKLIKKFTYQPAQTGDSAKSLKVMDFIMPAFSAFIAVTFPALLGIYWIYQSLLGIVQQIVLAKMYPIPTFTEEDYAKARKEMQGKTQTKKKANTNGKYNPRSLHHIDDDDDDPVPVEKKKPAADEDGEEDDGDRPATLLNGEKLPEQKGAVPPAALKEDVPAPKKKNKKDE